MEIQALTRYARMSPKKVRELAVQIQGRPVPEALDLLKAWGTGHPGGVGTIHAGTAIGALRRMEQLITPKQAASRIGVSVATVKAWMRRSADPLPSVQVGTSGKFRKVLAAEIPSWLAAEASRASTAAK